MATQLAFDDLVPGGTVNPASSSCLRWRDKAHSWRHVREGGFDRTRFRIEEIDAAVARDFVVTHHYSHSVCSMIRSFGLFEIGDTAVRGVAVFSNGGSPHVLPSIFPWLAKAKNNGENTGGGYGQPVAEKAYEDIVVGGKAKHRQVHTALDLGRFVLIDEVPGNCESWFLRQVFNDLARRGVRGVSAFSDPNRKLTTDGVELFRGHIGCIYQASSALFLGSTKAEEEFVRPTGTEICSRRESKTRNGESGAGGPVTELVSLGATPPAAGEDLKVWLTGAYTELGLPKAKPASGKYRYAFALGTDKRERAAVRQVIVDHKASTMAGEGTPWAPTAYPKEVFTSVIDLSGLRCANVVEAA